MFQYFVKLWDQEGYIGCQCYGMYWALLPTFPTTWVDLIFSTSTIVEVVLPWDRPGRGAGARIPWWQCWGSRGDGPRAGRAFPCESRWSVWAAPPRAKSGSALQPPQPSSTSPTENNRSKYSMISNKIWLIQNHADWREGKTNLVLRNLDMFVWASGFQNPFANTYFNMFVDECYQKP